MKFLSFPQVLLMSPKLSLMATLNVTVDPGIISQLNSWLTARTQICRNISSNSQWQSFNLVILNGLSLPRCLFQILCINSHTMWMWYFCLPPCWQVTVDIEDENDEAPVCTPSLYKAVIFDNVVAGTNVNGFKLNCHDRDSQDFEMRFEIVSGG